MWRKKPMATKLNNILSVFDYAVKAIIIIIGVVLWIQTQGNDKYYPKQSGDYLQNQVSEIKQELLLMRAENKKLLESLSRIEGKLEK